MRPLSQAVSAQQPKSGPTSTLGPRPCAHGLPPTPPPHACPTRILLVNKHTLTQANTHQKPRPQRQTPNFLGTPACGDTWGCGLREAIAGSCFAPTQVGPRFSGQEVFSLPEGAQTPSTGPCPLSKCFWRKPRSYRTERRPRLRRGFLSGRGLIDAWMGCII